MAGNIFDYLKWRGDLTFQQSSFNIVDSFVLSNLCYLKYRKTYDEPIDYVEAVNYAMDNYVPVTDPFKIFEEVAQLSKESINTNRYKNMKVYHHIDLFSEEEEKQFSATTYILGDGTAFVAFRGTDETLIGWKEDLNMAFDDNIPSHIEATKYINYIAEHLDMPLRIGGHSKGGNLAIWAGATMKEEYKNKLIHIFSHDGPGFSKKFLESEQFNSIKDRIFSVVPEGSIVGVLMNYLEYITVKADGVSLMQHIPSRWLIEGRGFVYVVDKTKTSKKLEKYINSLYALTGKYDMKKYVDEAFYHIKRL